MSLPFVAIDKVFGYSGPHVIAEIGAADGSDTIAYAQRYPRAIIHAFEPLQRNVESLNLKRALVPMVEPRIIVHPFALGEENKDNIDFWESRGAPLHRPFSGPWPYSSSLLEPKDHLNVHAWCKFDKTTTSVHRFDQLDCTAPDYVHIDVQGAELAVFRGFGRWLAAVRAIWMEVSSVELYAGQPLYDDVQRFMLEAGFTKLIDTAAGRISGDQFWWRK